MQDSFNEAAFPLRDKTIVFTGDLVAVKLRQAFAIAKELGAKVDTKVSAKTDFVVAGKDPSEKIKQAADQNVKVISETDFFAMVKTQRKSQREAKGPQ